MRVLSLFDGICCGHLALERAGIKIDSYDAYEIEKSAIKATQANFPDVVHHGDVTKEDFTKYKSKVDLLIGGSPCFPEDALVLCEEGFSVGICRGKRPQIALRQQDFAGCKHTSARDACTQGFCRAAPDLQRQQ